MNLADRARLKFTSANEIPVERAVLTRAEVEALVMDALEDAARAAEAAGCCYWDECGVEEHYDTCPLYVAEQIRQMQTAGL
jgi:hypothetical protein